jgi:hypothetical protein
MVARADAGMMNAQLNLGNAPMPFDQIGPRPEPDFDRQDARRRLRPTLVRLQIRSS